MIKPLTLNLRSNAAVLLIIIGLLVAPTAPAAPPDRTIQIGVLFSGGPSRWEMIDRAVVDGLRDHGYIEGRNVTIVRRAGTYPDSRMDGYAQELAGMKLDVIYTSCGWTAAAAGKATSTTPIVFGKASDPVARGLVKTLARPGANITGHTGRVPGLTPKMLELLHETLPDVRHVGVLLDARSKASRERFLEADAAARTLDLKLTAIDYGTIPTVDAALVAVRAAGVTALLTLPDDDLMADFLDQLHAATVMLRMPIVYPSRDMVASGGLMSYGPDSYTIYRRAVRYVDRIVNGANPGDLPIEQPTGSEFVINLKRANALGITIPRAALLRADYVMK